MKLAYFTSEYPKRSHTFIRREIEAIEAIGIPVKVFSIRKPPSDEILCEQDLNDCERTWSIFPMRLINVIRIHVKAILSSPVKYFQSFRVATRHRLPGMKSLLYSIFYFIEAIVFANKLSREKIDHVHVHFANVGSTITLIASRFNKFTWSMTLHGTTDYEYPYGVLLGEKIQSALFVGCISHFGKAQALRVTNYDDWHKIFVYRCGIDMSSIPHHKSNNDSEITIVCVARMSSEKGLMGLVTACKNLEYNKSIKVILIGDGPDRNQIEETVKIHKLDRMIQIVGYLSEREVLHNLVNADILALPSLMEGVPVVLMEAMAMNVCVVAPRLSGIPELVEDNKEGLLYTPADWEDFTDKLNRLICDSDLRNYISKRARKKINDQFSFNSCIKPLYDRFDNLH